MTTQASTLTLLFTDLVRSTELMDRLGDDAAGALLHELFQILRGAAAEHGGREVKGLGDGLMLTFPSAAAALACAASMQQQVASRNEDDGNESMGLRIGVNSGEVLASENDYFGTPVVVAKRLCDRAAPGETLVSDVARTLVGTRGGYRFVERGTLSLKGFSDPVKTFELDWRSTVEGLANESRQAEATFASHTESDTDQAAGLVLPTPLLGEVRGKLAGRVGELSALMVELEHAQSGDLRLVLLAGEPGIGKTRLAAELARIAHERSWEVLYGRCDSEPLVPFQPFVEALAGHAAHTPTERLRSELGANVSVLSRLLPDIAKRFPNTPAAPHYGDAETDRYMMFDAAASLLRAVAERNPLMLVLDDLHWADKPTMALLRELTRAPGATRMLLVGTYRDLEIGRDHPLSALIGQRHRGAPVSLIKLSGLSQPEVEALIAAWGGQPAPQDFAQGVWRETEGQPFFVKELLRHLLETGAILEREGHLSSELSIPRIGVPEGVKHLIESRLALLDDQTQRVLTIASVIGREFGLEVLERVGDLPGDRLLELLEEAAGAGLIAAVPGTIDVYAFDHALIREALYDDLSPSRRIRLHQRIGETLEQLGPDRAGQRLPELAHHYFAAATGSDALQKAIDYAVEAAVQAADQLAYEEAGRHYERAVHGLSLQGVDGERRCDLLLALGDSRWSAGEYAKAKAAFRSAAELAEELGLSRQLALAALGYGGPMAFRAGVQDHVLISLLERALEALPRPDSALKALVMGHLGTALSFVPLTAVQDRERGVALGTEAVAMARQLGDKAVLAEVLSNTAVARSEPTMLDEQLAATREAVALADEVGAAIPRAEGRVWLVAHLMELGEMAEADAEFGRLLELVEELRQPYFVWLSEILGALRALHEGRIADGERLVWQALDTGQKAQNPSSIELFAAQILMLKTVQGRLAELHAASNAITEHFVALPAFRCARSALCCSLGLEDEARADLDALAVDGFRRLPRDMFWLTSVDLLADACSALSDKARAAELYALLEPFGQRNVLLGAVAAPRGIAARALGVLAATTGRFDTAAEHFEAALAGNDRIGCIPGLAQTQLDYAQMLLTRGAPQDRQKADQLAADALALSRRSGMHGLERSAIALIEQVRRFGPSPTLLGAPKRRRLGAVAQQLSGDTKAALSVRGRTQLGKLYGAASDDELERRFGSVLAQRAMLTALARSFQPRMAFGFQGEIQFEFIHIGDEHVRAADWWTIRVRSDRAVARRRIAEDPAVSLHISLPDFVRVVSGVVNPVTVWFDNNVQIEGDVILGARLVELFGGVAPFEVLESSQRTG